MLLIHKILITLAGLLGLFDKPKLDQCLNRFHINLDSRYEYRSPEQRYCSASCLMQSFGVMNDAGQVTNWDKARTLLIGTYMSGRQLDRMFEECNDKADLIALTTTDEEDIQCYVGKCLKEHGFYKVFL